MIDRNMESNLANAWKIKTSGKDGGPKKRNRKRAPVSPIDFWENTVRPALEDGLDNAFPEFEFKTGSSGWWIARSAPSGYEDYEPGTGKLTGNSSGFRSFKSSKKFVPWLEYVSRKEKPRGQDFTEAVRDIANRLGIDSSCLDSGLPPDPEREKAREERETRTTLFESFLAITQAILQNEPAGKPARTYLIDSRGFKDSEIPATHLGAYTTTEDISKRLQSAGFTPEQITGSGLTYDSSWNGRLIGPWRDPRGLIGTFWARDLTGTVEQSKKYLYLVRPPKGMARSKEELVLANLDRALKEGGRENLVIVEGVLDVVSLPARGLGNVAAIGGDGKNLTPVKWESLAALGVKSVTLVMDNDKKDDGSRPGLEGIHAALKNCYKAKASPRVFVIHPVELGKEKDPDEHVRKHGVDSLKRVLSCRVHQYRFESTEIIARHKGNGDWTDSTKMSALDEALEFDSSRPTHEALELENFFWPEIVHHTGSSMETIAAIRETLLEKKARQAEEAAYKQTVHAAGKLLEDGSLDKAKELLQENLDRIKSEKRAQAVEPVRNLAEELEDNERHLARFRGKALIGLAQVTLPSLDRMTLGLRGLIIMAGPPNAGKTALTLQITVDAIRENPDAVFVFASIEMLRQEMLTRIRCYLAEMDWQTLVFGSDRDKGAGLESSWNPEETERLQAADRELLAIGNRIRILDSRNCPRITVERILQEINYLKEQSGATRAIVLIDYLQVLDVPDDVAKKIKTDTDGDKWRIAQAKLIRDSLRTDEDEGTVIVISEARKPSGGAGDQWGGGMADVMGAARGIYTPDVGILFRPLSDHELALFYEWRVPEQFEGDNEARKAIKKAWAKLQRQAMNEAGLSPCILDIAKARDGMTRGEIPLTFKFWELSFVEKYDWVKTEVPMVATPLVADRDDD